MKLYDEYKVTEYEWLGSIPAHWPWLFLSQTCSEQKIKNTGNTETNVLSLSYGRIVRKKNINAGLAPKDFATYQIVDKGNIILRLTDLQNDKRSLRTGLVRERGIITSAYTCLKPLENEMYLQLLLHAYDTRKYFYGLGGGVRQSIGFDDIRYLMVPFPSRKEQDQIVRFLEWKTSEVNHFIRKKREEINLLTALRRAIITRAVTKGLDYIGKTIDVPFWGEAVPAHWEERRFRSLFSLSKGLGITKANLQDTGIPCVNYGEVHSKYGFEVNPEIHTLRCVSESYLQSSPRSLLQNGDFVFADTSEDLEGSGNFTCLNSEATTFAGYHTIIARTIEPTNYRFLAYAFDSLAFRMQIRRKVNGVKVYSITRGILNGTYLMLPSTEEQAAIVAYLDEKCSGIDKYIAGIKNEIALISEYLTSMINDVVTGKVDVRDIAVPTLEPGANTELADEDIKIEEEIEETDEMEVIEDANN